MVGLGGYGMGVGILGIIAAVGIGFWYAASDDYRYSDNSPQNTNGQIENSAAESIAEDTNVSTESTSIESSESVPPAPSIEPVEAEPKPIPQSHISIQELQGLGLAGHSALTALYEQQAARLSRMIDVSTSLTDSPIGIDRLTLEETVSEQETRQVNEADDDEKDEVSPTQNDPPETVPPAPSQDVNLDPPTITEEDPTAPTDAEDTGEENPDELVIVVEEGVVDDLVDDVVDDLENATDELLELELDNTGAGSEDSGGSGNETEELDSDDRSGNNTGPG